MLNVKGILLACIFTTYITATSHGQDVTSPTLQTGKWRISLSSGYGFRTGKSDDPKQSFIDLGYEKSEVNSFFKAIKQGYKLTGQTHYMFWDNTGLGIDYSFTHSAGSLSGYTEAIDLFYYTIFSKIEDDVFTNYLGASIFSENQIGQSRFKVYSQGSLGLTMYREETLFNYSPMVFTGNALGVNTEIGIEYLITSKLSAGFAISYFSASISNVKVDNGQSTQTTKLNNDERESLNRFDLNIGLSYYL